MVVVPFIDLIGHLFARLSAHLQKEFEILIQIFLNQQNFLQSSPRFPCLGVTRGHNPFIMYKNSLHNLADMM